MIVVDTNVITYMTFGSNHSAAVSELYAYDPAWEVPLLWKSEFLNVLALYHSKKIISRDEALKALNFAERLIGSREHRVSAYDILRLTFQSTCSSYDCEFVALSENLSAKLMTYDTKILSQFSTLALTPEDYLAQAK